MLRLQIHNDHKEKHQSFEARLNTDESLIYLEGYGVDKEEAVSGLKKRVSEKIKELQDIDWDNFDWVSWDGKIVKK